jgi:drug/metabolite transporter (DMT)-like permease
MALGAVLFALMSFFARLASAQTSWALVAGARALARRRPCALGPLVVKDRRGIWLRSLFGTAAMLATFYAVGSPAISLGDATTLANLTPVFVAMAAPFVLGERAGRRVAIALPLCVVGVVLILRPALVFGGGPARTTASLVAAGVALSAAVFTAAAMMLLRKISPREGAEAIALHFSLVAAGACFLVALPSLSLPSGKDAGLMLAAGLSAGLGQLAMTRAYALERAARVSGMSYLAVVVAAILGAAFLGESPPPSAVAGMALVIAGGLVVTVAGVKSRD